MTQSHICNSLPFQDHTENLYTHPLKHKHTHPHTYTHTHQSHVSNCLRLQHHTHTHKNTHTHTHTHSHAKHTPKNTQTLPHTHPPTHTPMYTHTHTNLFRVANVTRSTLQHTATHCNTLQHTATHTPLQSRQRDTQHAACVCSSPPHKKNYRGVAHAKRVRRGYYGSLKT